MAVYFFITALLVKNAFYYFLLKNNKITKYAFLLLGFAVLLFSMFIEALTLDHKDGGLVSVILNIDFLLLLFSFILRLYSKLLDKVCERFNLVNPFKLIFGFSINIKYFYAFITVLQALLIIICFMANR